MKKPSDEQEHTATVNPVASTREGGVPVQSVAGSPLKFSPKQDAKRKDDDETDKQDSPVADPAQAEANATASEEVTMLTADTSAEAPREEKCDDDGDDDCDDKGGWLWWTGAGIGLVGGGIAIAASGSGGVSNNSGS